MYTTVYSRDMLTAFEVQAILDRIEFRRSHTKDCQETHKINRWGSLDGRKRCACPFYSCGVHDPAEGFMRKPTGEITEENARKVVKTRLDSGNPKAVLSGPGTPITVAIEDFMATVSSKERSQRTYIKYRTLMNQLAAFCRHKGYTTVQSFDQDAMLEFWTSWRDSEAPYKKGTQWSKNSLATCKRSLKTMRLFFARCLKRNLITEDPSRVIEVTPEPRRKKKSQVKFLNRAQMAAIMLTLEEDYPRMAPYNKLRLKALMLLMRWTGLRISDAVKLTRRDVKKDVLHIETRKSSTKVQLPLPGELMDLLNQLEPYEGDYLFWNRRSGESNITTCEHNFGTAISNLFQKANVKKDIRQASHRFRNTFAVHLLTKGVPLETVSLMLGHQNVSTTENYYADFSTGYMDRAERMVRKAWELGEDETL